MVVGKLVCLSRLRYGKSFVIVIIDIGRVWAVSYEGLFMGA